MFAALVPAPDGSGAKLAALEPQLATRRWLNYLGDDQPESAIRNAYGPNFDRLREVKRRYGPDNVFHLNHNITP